MTTFEAACIVAGNGIGGGLMALPYFAKHVGWLGTLAVMLAAWCVTAALHMMVADMLLAARGGTGLLSVFNEFLFKGRFKTPLTVGFFALLLVTLLFNLSVYITGGADIVSDLLGMPGGAAKLLVYGCAILVPLMGLKALGLSEKASVLVMGTAAVALVVVSLFKGHNPMEVLPRDGGAVLALYSMAMFSFSALFSVPQAVEGLERDARAIKRAIGAGVGINLVMSLMICLGALYASDAVTEVAIVGWSRALGLPIRIMGSLLVLFAMLTSFWAIALALSDMVCEQFKVKGSRLPAFIASTAPCLLLSLFSGATFTSFLSVAGGAVAVIIALLLLPAYRNARGSGAGALLGGLGGRLWPVLAIGVCYLLMAAGSFISV